MRRLFCLGVAALLLLLLPWPSYSLDVDPDATYPITGQELLELWSQQQQAERLIESQRQELAALLPRQSVLLSSIDKLEAYSNELLEENQSLRNQRNAMFYITGLLVTVSSVLALLVTL